VLIRTARWNALARMRTCSSQYCGCALRGEWCATGGPTIDRPPRFALGQNVFGSLQEAGPSSSPLAGQQAAELCAHGRLRVFAQEVARQLAQVSSASSFLFVALAAQSFQHPLRSRRQPWRQIPLAQMSAEVVQ